MLKSASNAVPIPGTSLILAFLGCPAWHDIRNDSIVAIFDRNDINRPSCFSRLALMTDGGYYYWGGIEALEGRKADDKAQYVVVTFSGADGGDWWSSFAFLRIDLYCRITVLSKLYSHYRDALCDKDCGGEKMDYRFLDNKNVEVTRTEFLFTDSDTDQEKEKVIKISRRKYDLEKLCQNPQLRVFPRGESAKRDDAMKDNRRTPLVWAIEEGLTSIATALLENKAADVDVKDRDNWTPLMWASEKGNLEVVKLLLNGGANVRSKDKDGWTSFLAASQEGHIEVVKLLLEKGSNVNEKDKDNYTPLMAAACFGHEPVVKLLLEKGADINAKDNSGRTALKIASKNGHTQIVELLKAHGAKE